MASVSRQLLTLALLLAPCWLAAEPDSSPSKLVSVGKIQPQAVSEFKEFFGNTFGHQGERHSEDETIPAKASFPMARCPIRPGTLIATPNSV